MALGSMKLEGSYMPFCGDWKSMLRALDGGREKMDGEGQRRRGWD
jgi:hypothetical protein